MAKIIILTGPIHSGKTTFLRQIIDDLCPAVPFTGYLSLARFSGNKRVGYDLMDLETNKKIPFLRTSGSSSWPQIGPYFLLPRGLITAQEIIYRAPLKAWLGIDELGPLELMGQGVWPFLQPRFDSKQQKFILVIRRNILFQAQQALEDYIPLNKQVVIEVLDPQAKEKMKKLLGSS